MKDPSRPAAGAASDSYRKTDQQGTEQQNTANSGAEVNAQDAAQRNGGSSNGDTRVVPRKPRIGDTLPASPPDQTSNHGGSHGGSHSDEDRQAVKKGRQRDAKSQEAPSKPRESGESRPQSQRKQQNRRGRGRGRSSRAPQEKSIQEQGDRSLPLGRYLMLVHTDGHSTHVAMLEGRSLIEYYVSHTEDTSTQIHGNIYLGRVENVLPSMESAFVDIGSSKNAVLYQGDVVYNPEEFERSSDTTLINQVLQPKQTIMCQVTKNPIGHKGARLTQEVSLAGRYVVLIPNQGGVSVSKQITDKERKRYREVVNRVKPEEHGIIVRTAARNSPEKDIEADVLRLLAEWEDIEKRQKGAKTPSLIYEEPDLALQIIREQFGADFRSVIVNDRKLFQKVRDYVKNITPKLADRVQFYDEAADDLPMFDRYHVKSQLRKALDKKVWLPSGGSLIIESTEALTVIDVNTGRNLGQTTLKDTIFQNNMEAAEEIARQLRLRDIGGIIVIDFVDMDDQDQRKKLMKAFRDALSRDKTRVFVIDISDLGLVQMTRKRIGEGLVESFTEQCQTCEGEGHSLLPLLEGV